MFCRRDHTRLDNNSSHKTQVAVSLESSAKEKKWHGVAANQPALSGNQSDLRDAPTLGLSAQRSCAEPAEQKEGQEAISLKPEIVSPETALRFTKLGYDPTLVDRYPSFVKALVETNLAKRLISEPDPIPLTQNGEPCIKVDGLELPWSEIEARFDVSRKGGFREVSSGDQYTYMAKGLTQWNTKTWGNEGRSLIASQQLPEGKWPQQHRFEVVMLKEDRHAWLRLLTPQGEVFSWGAALKDKTLNDYGPPASTADGVIASPDFKEYSLELRSVRAFEIDGKTADQLIQTVQDNARESFGFSWLGHDNRHTDTGPNNCNTIAAGFVQTATGSRPTTQSTLTEMWLRDIGLEWSAMPKLIRRPIGGAWAMLLSLTGNPVLTAAIVASGGTQAQTKGHPTIVAGPEDTFIEKIPRTQDC